MDLKIFWCPCREGSKFVSREVFQKYMHIVVCSIRKFHSHVITHAPGENVITRASITCTCDPKQSGNARLEWSAVMGARLYWLLLLVVVGLSTAVADDERISFDKWLDKYGYTPDSVDYGTWKANMEYVLTHNQRHSSFSVTLNKFAHLVCMSVLCVVVVHCSWVMNSKIASYLISLAWPDPISAQGLID